MDSEHKDCNLAQTSSLISKFSVPLNESKAALLGMDTLQKMVEILIRHRDIEPEIIKIDVYMDASCFGHLLRPDIAIKNRVINNIIVNIRNHNAGIIKILPATTIRFGWARATKNPSDLTSKMFLSPSEIINSNFYRRGPIDYLTKDPYDHIFLEVTQQGEKYTPPPTESGVVNLSNCSICSIPQMCLLFLANVRRIQPPRAYKQAEIGAERQLNEAGNDARKQRSNDILKSEIQACEINRVNEKMEQNSDHAN